MLDTVMIWGEIVVCWVFSVVSKLTHFLLSASLIDLYLAIDLLAILDRRHTTLFRFLLLVSSRARLTDDRR